MKMETTKYKKIYDLSVCIVSVLHPLSFWLAAIATGVKEWAVFEHKLEQWDVKAFAGLWDCGLCFENRNASAVKICLHNGDLYNKIGRFPGRMDIGHMID